MGCFLMEDLEWRRKVYGMGICNYAGDKSESICIENHVLPTSDEAESIWTKFGFIRPRWGRRLFNILFEVCEYKEVKIN